MKRPPSLTLLPLLAALSLDSARAASPEFQQAIADSQPLLYYQFNETTGDAVNHGSLGTDFDGRYAGSPVRGVPGLSGDAAVALQGIADFVESISEAPVGLTGNPDFTVEAVIFVHPAGAVIQWPPILHWGPTDPPADMRSVFFGFAGNEQDEAFVGFWNGGLRSPDGSMPAGRWHHLIWARTGGGTASEGSSLYLDGTDVTASLVPDPFLPGNDSTPEVESSLFRVNSAGDLARQFEATLDELVLFGRVLDASEAQAHHLALTLLFADGFESGDTSSWN